MPIQYDTTNVNPALAAQVNSTLSAARQVPNSKLNQIEASVQSNGINFVVITDQIPVGFIDTGSAYMSSRATAGFNDTLYIVIPSSRQFLTTGGTEIDPGIGVVHELGHHQLGRPTERSQEGEALAVQDHIDVGRQLGIPDSQLRPGGTWPRQLNENDTAPTLSVDKEFAENELGHSFGGTQDEINLIKEAIATGHLTALGDYVAIESTDRFLASFDPNPDKVVVSFDPLGSFASPAHYASIVTHGAVDRTIQFNLADGIRIETTSDPSNLYDWNREVIRIHPDGLTDEVVVGDNGAVSSSASGGGQFTAGDIGAVFGSNLGRQLGGNSLAGQLTAGTVIGAIGKEVGNALFSSASFSIDTVVNNAFGKLSGGSGVGSLPSGAIGAVSSLLMSELADALNLHGFEGGLFQTAGTTITTQLVTNAYGVMTGAAINGVPYTMFSGFDSGAIFLQLEGAIAGYFGSTLAAHVAMPHYSEGAVGEQIGSSVGSVIGTYFGGPLGAFVGSFLGGIAGSFFGDLFGNDPEAHGTLDFDPVTHKFVLGYFEGAHGGSPNVLGYIATHQAKAVNDLADFAGAQLVGVAMHDFGGGAVPYYEKLIYTQDGRDFMINEPLQASFTLIHNVSTSDDLTPLFDAGIMKIVHNVHLAGGDILERRAWDNSHATNSTAFGLDLQIAKDYRAYLDDKDAINALMAAEPESSFTAGWVLTLLKARELGLDAAPAPDDFRNGSDALNGGPGADMLIGKGGNDIGELQIAQDARGCCKNETGCSIFANTPIAAARKRRRSLRHSQSAAACRDAPTYCWRFSLSGSLPGGTRAACG